MYCPCYLQTLHTERHDAKIGGEEGSDHEDPNGARSRIWRNVNCHRCEELAATYSCCFPWTTAARKKTVSILIGWSITRILLKVYTNSKQSRYDCTMFRRALVQDNGDLYTVTCPASALVPSFKYAPTATLNPSPDKATDHPD